MIGRTEATWVPSSKPVSVVPPRPVGVRVLPGGGVVVTASDGLWRSTDFGHSWRRTLTFSSGITGFGLGDTGGGVIATAGDPQGTTTLLYESTDGDRWTSFTTPTSLMNRTVRLRSTTPDAVGFAYLDLRRGAVAGRDQVLRTGDGGRHWTPMRSPAIAGVAFVPGARSIFAAVPYSTTESSDCGGHLVRSDDDGLTWRTLADTCTTQSLLAVQFVDGQHGFAAGGTANHYAGSQLVYATSDGGTTWTRRFTTGTVGEGGSTYPDAFADIAFTSPTTGFAVGGECVGSDEGPCGGPIAATTDGGRTWVATGATALELSAVAGVVAITGDGYRPVDSVGTQVSVNGGASWWRSISPVDVTVAEVSRSSTGLLAETNTGLLTSTDGVTWHAYALAPGVKNRVPLDARIGAHGIVAEVPALGRLGWSGDGGRTWTPSRGGMFVGEGVTDVRLDSHDDQRAIAYDARSDCSTTVFASSDTGRTWSTVGALPFAIGGYGEHTGYDNHVAAAVGLCHNRSYLAVSVDDGHDWTVRELGYGYDLIGAGVAAGSVWVTGADGKGNGLALVSQDDGASWTAHDLVGLATAWPSQGYGFPVPLSGRSALLFTGDGALWRTTDAGASWRQELPDLAPPS